MRTPVRAILIAVVLLVPLAACSPDHHPTTFSAAAPAPSPIKHVVVIFQENHSFDNVLGSFCVGVAAGTIVRNGSNMNCDGVDQATTMPGSPQLTRMPDIVPGVDHTVGGQTNAIDGGKMDGWLKLNGCQTSQCLARYVPAQSPNIVSLASGFALSDRTFEMTASPSWEGHLQIVAATLDGFKGNNPRYIAGPGVPAEGWGWGCDSNKEVRYGTPIVWVPACVPDFSLPAATFPNGGAFGPTPAKNVPTIMQRLDGAGLSWTIYAGKGQITAKNHKPDGYHWAICPSFAGCLYTNAVANFRPDTQIISDAGTGALPAFSVVTPTAGQSQHNSEPWTMGENWIGNVVSAIENGPDWSSTAIFLTWDDCGCFYDHVPPFRAGWGIRVPMVIISPYARAGFTDSTPTTFAGILAYVEHNFGLVALNNSDAKAYDFANAFDYSQTPLAPVAMTRSRVPPSSRRWVRTHPPASKDVT
jgi:phospholipase C